MIESRIVVKEVVGEVVGEAVGEAEGVGEAAGGAVGGVSSGLFKLLENTINKVTTVPMRHRTNIAILSFQHLESLRVVVVVPSSLTTSTVVAHIALTATAISSSISGESSPCRRRAADDAAFIGSL
jgi:hypothetical protein